MTSGVSLASSVSSSKRAVSENCDFCQEKLSGIVTILDSYHIFHRACLQQLRCEQNKSLSRVYTSEAFITSSETSRVLSDSKKIEGKNPLLDPKVQNDLVDALVVIAAQKGMSEMVRTKVASRFLHKKFPFFSRNELIQILAVREKLSDIVKENGGTLSRLKAESEIRRLLECTNPLLSSS